MWHDRENKNIALFLAGKTVSQAGSIIYTFAVGWYVLSCTGSAATFGMTLALGILPMVLVMPIAGVVADRYDKKRMIVGMDTLNGVLFIGMYLFSLLRGLPLVAIYSTTVMTTILTTFFSVSLEAAKPNLVSKERLMGLNASSRMLDSAISISGPVLGGLAYGLIGIELFLLLNGISFLISALSESRMAFQISQSEMAFKTDAEETSGYSENYQQKFMTMKSIVYDLKEGFHGLTSDTNLMSVAWNLMAINFFLGFSISVPIPYVLSQTVENGEKFLGVVQGALPLGVILGAILIGRLKWEMPHALKWANGILSITLMCLTGLLIFRSSIPAELFQGGLMLVMGLIGIGVAWIDLPLSYHFLVTVPEQLRGRTLSVMLSMAKLAVPVALFLSGALVGAVPTWGLPLIGGLFYMGVILYGILKKRTNIKREKSLA